VVGWEVARSHFLGAGEEKEENKEENEKDEDLNQAAAAGFAAVGITIAPKVAGLEVGCESGERENLQ
jgi:hypothetical protein